MRTCDAHTTRTYTSKIIYIWAVFAFCLVLAIFVTWWCLDGVTFYLCVAWIYGSSCVALGALGVLGVLGVPGVLWLYALFSPHYTNIRACRAYRICIGAVFMYLGKCCPTHPFCSTYCYAANSQILHNFFSDFFYFFFAKVTLCVLFLFSNFAPWIIKITLLWSYQK